MNKSEIKTVPVSVAIPTYGREQVLLDTIEQFLKQEPAAGEILVMDQTKQHEDETEKRLGLLYEEGAIRWLKLDEPSQPEALNRALLEASQPIVLFVDDDINIVPQFVYYHAKNYSDGGIWAVAGQVIQPEQGELKGWKRIKSNGFFEDIDFPFNSDSPALVKNGMSGNLSVLRDKAIELGGFDENFTPPVSYRFDAEFCKRLCRGGGKILFEPSARIYHLRYGAGGTRKHGSHLKSISPEHGAGDYYFALRQGISIESLFYILKRPFREVCTKFHLRKPWWIPVKFIGEIRSLFQAVILAIKGPRLMTGGRDKGKLKAESSKLKVES